MGINIKDSGNWRSVQEVHIKDSGTWRKIDEAYVKDGGVWRKVFPEFKYQMTLRNTSVYTSAFGSGLIQHGFAEFDAGLTIGKPYGKIDNVESDVDGTSSYKVHTATVGPGNNYTTSGTPGTSGSNTANWRGGMPTNQSSDSSNSQRPNANFGSMSATSTDFDTTYFYEVNSTTGEQARGTLTNYRVLGFATSIPTTNPATSTGYIYAIHFKSHDTAGASHFFSPYNYFRLIEPSDGGIGSSVFTGRTFQGAGSGSTSGGKIAFGGQNGTGGYRYFERTDGNAESVGNNVFFKAANGASGNLAYPLFTPNVASGLGFQSDALTLELYQCPLIGMTSYASASHKAGGQPRVQRYTRLLACYWQEGGSNDDKLTLVFDDESWEVTDLFTSVTLSNGTNSVTYTMGSYSNYNTATGVANTSFSANRSSFYSVTEYIVSGIPSGSRLYQLFDLGDNITISINQ